MRPDGPTCRWRAKTMSPTASSTARSRCAAPAPRLRRSRPQRRARRPRAAAADLPMGAIRPPAPVQPIVGLLGASTALLADARAALTAAIAPIALASPELEWRQSDYYRAEMGDEIWRQYLALDALMAPHDLAE